MQSALHRPRLARALGLACLACAASAAPAPAHGGRFVPPPASTAIHAAPVPAPDTGRFPGPPSPAPRGPLPAARTPPTALPPGPGPSATPGAVTDLPVDGTEWRFWWRFNSAPLLDLRRRVHGPLPRSDEGAFYLGSGPVERAPESLRPTDAVVHERVVPALRATLARESGSDVITACLIALAKIGEDPDGPSATLPDALLPHLRSHVQEVSETAALALGILGEDAAVPPLLHLLTDTEEGRRLVGREGRVPERTRAFAAHALGLAGGQSESAAVRREVASSLARVLIDERHGAPQPDVAAACVLALGLVPLEPGPRAESDAVPAVTLEAQIELLLALLEDEAADALVRAHAPTSLARLVRDLPSDASPRRRVVEALLPPLARRSRALREVQQSCVLALGELGDADDDELDRAVRDALASVDEHVSDRQARLFADVALAQVGGRPGRGAGDPLAGAAQARRVLMEGLGRGNAAERRWAGLSLGLLERSLTEAGQLVDGGVSKALRSALVGSRAPLDVGAYALALGLARDPAAAEPLLEKLATTGDPSARAEIALALGLVGARSAADVLHAEVRDAAYRPEMLEAASVGLALLEDRSVVPALVATLADSRSLAAQASLASALGRIGDARSVDALLELLGDEARTPRARAFAAVALGSVAEKGPLPWSAALSVGLNYRANPHSLTDGMGTGVLDIL